MKRTTRQVVFQLHGQSMEVQVASLVTLRVNTSHLHSVRIMVVQLIVFGARAFSTL